MQLVNSDNPVLRLVCDDWDFEKDGDGLQLEIDLVKTMIDSGGIGLAASQVGVNKRVFAIHLTDQVPFCMFNPLIVKHSKDSIEGSEGCLSFPDLFLKVKRYSVVSVEYFDRRGQKCIMELSGIDARCFQHELDHLNGICFTDKISQLKLAFARKKQQKRKRNG